MGTFESPEDDFTHYFNATLRANAEIAKLQAHNKQLYSDWCEAVRVIDITSQALARAEQRIAELEAWQPVEDVDVQCVCDAPNCVGVLHVGIEMIEIENCDGMQSMVLPVGWAVCRRVSS